MCTWYLQTNIMCYYTGWYIGFKRRSAVLICNHFFLTCVVVYTCTDIITHVLLINLILGLWLGGEPQGAPLPSLCMKPSTCGSWGLGTRLTGTFTGFRVFCQSKWRVLLLRDIRHVCTYSYIVASYPGLPPRVEGLGTRLSYIQLQVADGIWSAFMH